MSFVLVSGASGYIAQHTIRILLEKGYKVIGTVRTQEKADSVAQLFNSDNLVLELVPELAKIDAFDHVFEKYNTQIKHVIHTASPVRYNMTDFENEMLLPAINGTRSVLESIKKFSADSVETVVYTSSISALANPAGMLDSMTFWFLANFLFCLGMHRSACNGHFHLLPKFLKEARGTPGTQSRCQGVLQ